MTKPTPIGGLSELRGRYDVLLSDVWGVIHNGQAAFPTPCAALARWQAEGGLVVLISNAPRPHAPILEQLAGLGVPAEAHSAVVTSGDATRPLLAAKGRAKVWRVGPERDWPLYEGLDLVHTELEDAEFIALAGPFDDTFETPEHYRERFTRAVSRGLPMICANPDKVVQRGDTLIYCGGALAELYAAMGGEVTMAGKPHAPIYDLALGRAAELLGRPLDRSRVLCIGDGVTTDVLGANAQRLDVLFVAQGIHGDTLMSGGALNLAAVEARLAEDGAVAQWVTPEVSW